MKRFFGITRPGVSVLDWRVAAWRARDPGMSGGMVRVILSVTQRQGGSC